MSRRYGVAVLGLGGMGSATAYHLARRGVSVLGLDANPRGHALGSSHGHSRTTRTAYREGAAYVPLVRRATALWRDLEDASSRRLLTMTGLLMVGRPGHPGISGLVHSARAHHLAYEELTGEQAMDRFSGLHVEGDSVAAYDPNAGLLAPEACIAAHLDLATKCGANLRHEEAVLRWERRGSTVEIVTAKGVYECDRLSITAGPWSGAVLRDLHLPLTVDRVCIAHFASAQPALFTAARSPVYVFAHEDGNRYVAPPLGDEGIKVGWHHGRDRCAPDTIRRVVSDEEVQELKAVLDQYLPAASGPLKQAVTCMYTMTPDTHFVIDCWPGEEGVFYAAGFSGHGFKFASVIGEILADLATRGRTAHDIGFLSSTRFRSASS